MLIGWASSKEMGCTVVINKKRCGLIALNFVLLLIMQLNAGIDFSSDDAKIKLATSGTKLNIARAMTITNGTFQRVTGTSMTGANIVFNNSIFMQDNTQVALYANMTYSPTNIFALTGGTTYDAKDTTTSLQGLTATGQDNLVVGAPMFHGTNALTLTDNTTTVSLAIKSSMDRKIVLNGGRLYLVDNLNLGNNAALLGVGSIFFNDHQIALDSATSVWTGTTRFLNTSNLVLNGDVRVSGQMIFDGNGTVNGNGSALDLSLGGTIRIKANSTVNFNNVKIKGLNKHGNRGTGSGGCIVFDAPSSSMHIDQAELELNSNYTFTTGNIYVESASNIGVKNYTLTFDQRATLTVDGTSLTYEPLSFQDQNNIVGVRSFSLNNINGGTLRTLRTNPSQYNFNVDTTLGIHIVLSASKTINIGGNITLNGNKTFLYMGSSTTPLLIVQPGYTLTLTNIILMNFSFSQVQLGAGSNIVFGDGVQMEFGINQTLPTAYMSNFRCQGNVKVLGRGQTLDLSNTASITIAGRRSALMLDNVTLKNLRGTSLRVMHSNSTVSLKDSTLKLSSTYTFTQGHLEVVGDSKIMGDGQIFSYTSPQTSSICSRAMLTIDRNTTFSYSPHGSTNKGLIWMPDITSVLYLNGATLKTTTTGIQFKRGTLLIDGKVNLYNDSATRLSQAIIFGDGVAGNDANISIMPAASINLQTGLIDYRNVS